MFKNRQQAGLLLALKVKKTLPCFKDYLVFAIPRGGVVVGEIFCDYLSLPLFLIIAKKIGAPGNLELALGAVGPGGWVVWDKKLLQTLKISKRARLKLQKDKEKEREDREKLFGVKPEDVENKKIIVVDDGVATGATALAVLNYFRQAKAQKVVLATPVIAFDTFAKLVSEFDKIIFLAKPLKFGAVGEFYEYFPQVGDKEVAEIIKREA